MPHITLEYSANLINFDSKKALAKINQATIDTGLFSETNIKSRAIERSVFQIGVEQKNRAFIHVTTKILEGQPSEQREKLSSQILAALESAIVTTFDGEIQMSVETVDIHKASYVKKIISQ